MYIADTAAGKTGYPPFADVWGRLSLDSCGRGRSPTGKYPRPLRIVFLLMPVELRCGFWAGLRPPLGSSEAKRSVKPGPH